LISTQDLEDDEFATDKENENPWQAESRKRLEKDGSSQENDTIEGDDKRGAANGCEAVRQTQAQRRPFYGAIFDDGDFADLTSDLDDGYDDYDNDLDDEALAALAAESPSAHKLALLSTKSTTTTADESPKRVKNFVNTSSIPGHASDPHNMRLQDPRPTPPTEGNSFSFDGVQDDDLTAFADELDSSDLSAGPQVGTGTKSLRAIPWKMMPHHSPPLQVRMSV
jgi:hypothetical protein